MATPEKEEDSFDGSPIITYSNRIQKHFFKLTEELTLNNRIEMTERRKLRLIIANLPPEAKLKLQHVYERCESQDIINTAEFDKMYGEVHNWVYNNILQDAFRIKPRYGGHGKL
jgi:hypothetical protein